MGEWTDKIEGKAKEVGGTVTGDDSMETEGKAQNTWGSVQGTANDLKDTVKSAVGNASEETDSTDGSTQEPR